MTSRLPPATIHTTHKLVEFVDALRFEALDAEVRHFARRHLLDTVGVMIAGAQGDVATRAENVLRTIRAAGSIPVPGRARRADMLDAAFLGGTAAHGIELDDGYRQGSVHPGCAVVPAALAVGYHAGAAGKAVMEAVVAGYETTIAIARACHPELRQRGFHPTGACAVFGATATVAKLRGLPKPQITDAMGIAASSAAGLFAFVRGSADVKRLHAGHASREGMQAALLAEQGVQGPYIAIEGRDGFMEAFAFGDMFKAKPIALPPAVSFGITDCYIKPYACCRHIQPAVEAVIGLCRDNDILPDQVKRIEVDTYKIAQQHRSTGWENFASAQLSFPYLIGLALHYRAIRLEHFTEAMRQDPVFDEIDSKLSVTATPETDRLYPKLRPARVKITTARGVFSRSADEALGSRLVPLDDTGLRAKFDELAGPVLSPSRASALADRLWDIESCPNVREIVDMAAQAAA
jgi:2-methylcitrate dehydratase PrpD